MTCIAAVFAKLPISTAIYFPSADLIVSAKAWIGAAATAMKDEFLSFQWINSALVHLTQDILTINSNGCAAFNRHKVWMPAVRTDRTEALKNVHAATVMMGGEEAWLRNGIRLFASPRGSRPT